MNMLTIPKKIIQNDDLIVSPARFTSLFCVAIKKKEDTHKMAEANKAFAHFAW